MSELPNGITLIAAERSKQYSKGYNDKHDDVHDIGEIAQHAAILAASESPIRSLEYVFGIWDDWKLREKYTDPVKRLVVAGALIAAEIDRLQRLKEKQ